MDSFVKARVFPQRKNINTHGAVLVLVKFNMMFRRPSKGDKKGIPFQKSERLATVTVYENRKLPLERPQGFPGRCAASRIRKPGDLPDIHDFYISSRIEKWSIS